jgi:hypothetical protein
MVNKEETKGINEIMFQGLGFSQITAKPKRMCSKWDYILRNALNKLYAEEVRGQEHAAAP